MVARSGAWAPAGTDARSRWWISATGKCPLTSSSTASTWIRDAIRRSPRTRRKSPIRSVTAGSRADSFDVTRSVSRQPLGIASAGQYARPERFLQVSCIKCMREPTVGTVWSRLRSALSSAEWSRLAVMLAAIVALHLLGWVTLVYVVEPARLSLGGKAFGIGVGLTAYTLGLRHAFDADHIAAIDNTTRKLMNDGQRPLATGFFFSLGHSTVVFGLALLFATGVRAIIGPVEDDSSQLHHYTGLIGTSVSGVFLYLIAILNVIVLVGILRVFVRLRRGDFDLDSDGAELEQQLQNRGLLNRFLGRFTKSITKSWHMYPVGLL